MKTARITVPGLRVSVPLKADALPPDLVPPEPAPPGEPTLELILEGGLMARAKLNGRNYRKLLKQLAAHDPADVVIVLQATLKPPAAKGDPFVLEGAGFQVSVKASRPGGGPPPPPSGGGA